MKKIFNREEWSLIGVYAIIVAVILWADSCNAQTDSFIHTPPRMVEEIDLKLFVVERTYTEHEIFGVEFVWSKQLTWGCAALFLAGFFDGINDAYTIDRHIYERIWGVDPRHPLGSESWKNDHTWYAKNFGVPDLSHLSRDFSAYTHVMAGVIIGPDLWYSWKNESFGIASAKTLLAIGTRSGGHKLGFSSKSWK